MSALPLPPEPRPLAKSSKPLTERQAQVLDYIRSFRKENGYPPTLREIGKRMGTGSTNGTSDHLRALERKGFISIDSMTARGIVLLDQSVPGEIDTTDAPREDLTRENVRLRALLRQAHAALHAVTGPMGDACGVVAEIADELRRIGAQ